MVTVCVIGYLGSYLSDPSSLAQGFHFKVAAGAPTFTFLIQIIRIEFGDVERKARCSLLRIL